MQVLGVDRVLVATPSLDESCGLFADRLGVSFGERIDPPGEPVANRMSPAGLEFVTADDAASPVGEFLAAHGPGIYALALEVADLEAAREHLAGMGVEAIGETSMGAFRELFYHPRDFEGVLLVLTEYEHRHPAEVAALDGGRSDGVLAGARGGDDA